MQPCAGWVKHEGRGGNRLNAFESLGVHPRKWPSYRAELGASD